MNTHFAPGKGDRRTDACGRSVREICCQYFTPRTSHQASLERGSPFDLTDRLYDLQDRPNPCSLANRLKASKITRCSKSTHRDRQGMNESAHDPHCALYQCCASKRHVISSTGNVVMLVFSPKRGKGLGHTHGKAYLNGKSCREIPYDPKPE
jgi:hypothetical protein